MKNILYDSQDFIDFGQMKGEQFFWIYRLNHSYFEWLIRKTNICFTDLNLFKMYGKPISLKPEISSSYRAEDIMNIIKENGINNFSGNSKSYVITPKILDKLLSLKIISNQDFHFIDFEFTKELLEINKNKLLNCLIKSNNGIYNSVRTLKYLY